MRRERPLRILPIILVLFLSSTAYAQQSVVEGTVRDTTGAVLPGVAITAVLEATGNTFEAVTDGLGTFRMPVRPGVYRITAALPGFTTVTRSNVELLTGQVATVNTQLAPSALQENVTVTADTPLIETTVSSVGGNIEPRQIEALPVQGRDWASLALLAPGNRTTAVGEAPVEETRNSNMQFNLNLDGQQVADTNFAGRIPARYSRDTIAEFEFISNRFDATQGRSPAAMVNAVSKSGTNTLTGLFSGYFRDSDWNAKDHILNGKVPSQNLQVSTAGGGPIVQDRLHYFGSFEYTRSPTSLVAQTPYPRFNDTVSRTERVNLGGGRVDYEISPGARVMLKGDGMTRYGLQTPARTGTLGGAHVAAVALTTEKQGRGLGTLTNVLSNRALNEIKAGYTLVQRDLTRPTNWSNHWQAANGITNGNPLIMFRGLTVGGPAGPLMRQQEVMSARDDFMFSFAARGRHDVKVGGELLWSKSLQTNCESCAGVIDARGGPIPSNIEDLLPDNYNVDRWNLAALSPIVTRYELGIAQDRFYFPETVPKWGAWFQDDWQISDRLTLNLGVRYDLLWNAFGQNWALEPWLVVGRSQDVNNIQPRIGFAYSVNDRTVIRGGSGLYYADVSQSDLMWAQLPSKVAFVAVTNDGRPDFAANPFNGPAPTFEQASQRFCYVRNVPGCLTRDLRSLPPPSEYAGIAAQWQNTIGFQREVAAGMALAVDYVYSHGFDESIALPNVNLTYDAATGVNFPFTDRSRRFDPNWGIIGMQPKTGWSNYRALQAALTKRFSHRWQGGATYTFSGLWNGDPRPLSGLQEVSFPVTPDLGGDYSLAVTDQRHRFAANGIWVVGGGFQVSGTYFYGSGQRLATTYGVDLRGVGASAAAFGQRLRPNGTIIDRSGLVKGAIHRVDMSFQQHVPIVRRVALEGIVEVFNLFDRANVGSYETNEASALYGRPQYDNNLAYGARALQLGFRLTF